MAYNDFRRSELGIRPKERLMSAGSYINPVRTYDADEQRRIVESFRGLSAQTDKMIDGFIAKQQEKAQAKYDEWLTNTLQDPSKPGHEKVKEAMDKLKPRVANLLGVDYWTTQYIARGQAELLFQQEKQDMLLGYNENGDANKSPDEYVAQLGNYRKASEERVATFPKEVQRYFNKMPRAELMNTMRDKHIKDVMQEQIAARDNIATNKIYNTLDELANTWYSTPDLKDETLDLINYEDYEKSLTDKATKEEIDKVSLLYDWKGQRDEAGYFMPIDYKADILQYRKLSQSPVVDNVIANMREMAAAGMTHEQIAEKTYAGFVRFVKDNEDLGDEADILFNVVMDKANKDTALQKEAGTWGYTSKNNIADDHNIALFNMSDITAKGKTLRQTAIQAGALKQAEYEANQIKDRQAIWSFLNDTELAKKLNKDDILYKSTDEIAKQLGLNGVEAGEFIDSWRQKRVAALTVPLNDSHYFQYDKWKHDIHTGKITSEKQIYDGLLNNEFHPRHYNDLVNELENGGQLSAREQQLFNYITKYAKKYVEVAFANEPQKMLALMQQVDNLAWDGIRDGTFTSIYDTNDYGSKILQIIGAIPSNKELTPNNSTTLNELQTREQFKETAGKDLTTPTVDDRTKIAKPQIYFDKEYAFDEFLKSDAAKNLVALGTNEEELRNIYDDLYSQSRQTNKEETKRTAKEMFKKGGIKLSEIPTAFSYAPEVLEEVSGFKWVMVDGIPLPENEIDRYLYGKIYNRAIGEGRDLSIKKIVDDMRIRKAIIKRQGLKIISKNY